jgi:glycosyltransferase involved in cell wall biosynthesis
VLVNFIGIRGVPARYSGFETCVENVGARMAEAGHEVTVFCRGTPEGQPRSHRGMRLRYLPAFPGKHSETISHTFLTSLLLGPGAVVCMGVGNAPVVRLLELRGWRTVWNVDGADWARAKWGRGARAYLSWCERRAAGSRSLLVADAETVRRHYVERHGRATELVSYGAEAPAATGTSVLEDLGLRPDSYALFVGRLEPENGAHDFLAAAALAGPGLTAVVTGGAPHARAYIQRLEAMAPAGTVFTGFRFGDDYQQLRSHAGVFVLAATVGGTHPVLLEQMAAGRCVLARDLPEHREVLGDTGLYWTSPAELATLLTRVTAEPALRGRLGADARARQAELYDWDRVTAEYIELCRRSLQP